MLAMAARAGIISTKFLLDALGAEEELDMFTEMFGISTVPYEEMRERVLELCRTEGHDMSLHNDVVAELLQYMDGGAPEFGNVVGEICMKIESNPLTTVSQATFDFITGMRYTSPWNNVV